MGISFYAYYYSIKIIHIPTRQPPAGGGGLFPLFNVLA